MIWFCNLAYWICRVVHLTQWHSISEYGEKCLTRIKTRRLSQCFRHTFASTCAPLFPATVSYISPPRLDQSEVLCTSECQCRRRSIECMARLCCSSLSLVTLWIASYPFRIIRGKKRRGQRTAGGEKNGKGLRHFSMKGWDTNLCLSFVYVVCWDCYLYL